MTAHPISAPVSRNTQVVAAVIGNALEWYDFVVFGFLTVAISRLFFPQAIGYSALLLATATYGVGFVTRPIGGVLMGAYADRRGRKAALQLIFGMMAVSMAMLALAPPYAAIGIAAPLVVLLARLLQGFATGGEFATATAFLVESAPRRQQGLYGSFQGMGQCIAALGGAFVAALLTHALTPEQLVSWGWRVPFALGLLIGPIGIYIRRHMAETEEFLEAEPTQRDGQVLKAVVTRHLRGLLVTFGLIACGAIGFNVLLVYMPTFASTQLGIPLERAFVAQVIGLIGMIILTPLFGAWSDHVGRKPIMLVATGSYLIVLVPIFAWIHRSPSFGNLVLMQIVLCGLAAAFAGPVSTAVAREFPASVRSTGLALGHNMASVIFGGFAPFIVTWLLATTGSPVAPAYYLMFGAAMGFSATLLIAEHREEPVNDPRGAIATQSSAGALRA